MNLLNQIKNKQSFVHFSVDDVWRIFSQKGRAFNFLESLHEEFGLVTSLYVFSEPKGKKFLHKVATNHLQKYPWLKFGPHAPDWDHPLNTLNVKEQLAHIDYVYRQLVRIVGQKNIADNVRLHSYKGSREVCQNLAQRGVKTLFTQNFWDHRVSYCLPPNSRRDLNRLGWYREPGLKVNFIKTGLGVEFRKNIKYDTLVDLKHHNFVVFFTHEEHLTDPKIQRRIRTVLRICQAKGVKFVY